MIGKDLKMAGFDLEACMKKHMAQVKKGNVPDLLVHAIKNSGGKHEVKNNG